MPGVLVHTRWGTDCRARCCGYSVLAQAVCEGTVTARGRCHRSRCGRLVRRGRRTRHGSGRDGRCGGHEGEQTKRQHRYRDLL